MAETCQRSAHIVPAAARADAVLTDLGSPPDTKGRGGDRNVGSLGDRSNRGQAQDPGTAPFLMFPSTFSHTGGLLILMVDVDLVWFEGESMCLCHVRAWLQRWKCAFFRYVFVHALVSRSMQT